MLKIYTLTRNDILGSNCYFLWNGDECAVVDPSVALCEFQNRFTEIQKYKIKYVLLTHAHADHFIEIKSYLSEETEVLVSEADAEALADGRINLSLFLGKEYCSYTDRYKTLADGECIRLGDTEIKVIYTAGHTPGSVVFLAENKLFTGDTIFAGGGYGRCDLPMGNAILLRESLKRLLALDGDYIMYPGHGDSETLACAREYFDYLQ